ncbi:MAG: ShlB/FhaC/HecB family hemolysin secretion/activation protein [Xenococcaceae cyanobacterium MO_207.B15]|nr:ShlB/FhaC/HecB family hemolysin secretion/activation protein [Xenococcaceae cyanobacterium MO_207.B15]
MYLNRILAAFFINVTVAILMGSAATANIKVAPKEQTNILVEQINFEGNTVFTDSDLEALFGDIEGKEVTSEQLFELRDKLTEYYISRGYANSGAFIPPQKFADGNVKIRIVEGSFSAINITGLSSLSEKYVKSRLPTLDKPVNLKQLAKYLGRLRSSPLIKELNAEIIPLSVGKNVLLLNIEENNPVTAKVIFNNAYNRSIGRLGVIGSITHNNLFGWGDSLSIRRSQTEGLGNTGGGYSVPFNKMDGRIEISFNSANIEIVEDVAEDLGIEADFTSLKLSIRQPVIFDSKQNLTLGIAFQFIDSETFVLEDLSFAFTEGLEDGLSRVSILSFTADYLRTPPGRLLFASSEFKVGLDIFDATKTDAGIDGIFWAWQGKLEYLISFDENNNAILATRIAAQLTPDKLLPVQQFTIGGLDSVRGYLRNLGVADNGVTGTIELQLTLVREDWGAIAILPFVDVGTIWNNDRETAGDSTFASTGLAIRYRLRDVFEIRGDYGFPLIDLKEFGATDVSENFTVYVTINPLKIF